MMWDQLVREGEVDFAKPLARALLRDARLSWGARGLFAFLWDLPAGWRPNSIHIAKMGPDGRDAVRARLAELEKVGALRIELIRGEGGQLAGKRWVLVAPERWARESPLSGGSTPKTLSDVGITEGRISRSSANPKIGKPNSKVLQKTQGSPNKRPPPPIQTPTDETSRTCPHTKVVDERDLDDLRQALISEAKAGGKRKPEAWSGAAIRRIRQNGADPEDLALLERWRDRKAAEAAYKGRLNEPPPGMVLASLNPSEHPKSVPPPDWDAPVRLQD